MTERSWRYATIEEQADPKMAPFIEVDQILTERRATHGEWRQTAGCCHAIKEAMNIWRTATLTATQKETLDQLAVKMARINCGDPNEPDHYDDIAGYGRNEANECRRKRSMLHPHDKYYSISTGLPIEEESVK